MKLRTLKTRNLSGMQAYELEMLSLAQNVVKSLLRHNSYSKEQILEIYDKLLNFETPKASTKIRLR